MISSKLTFLKKLETMAKSFEDAKAGTLKVKSYFGFASEAEYEDYLASASVQ